MQDRFKFRAVLKTDTHSIITEPYYILGNGYLVNIDDVQKPFEKKYPDDCFWEFLEEIEKQKNCQEVSIDSEIIIFDSFDNFIQCTGLKDKNGKLIYEGDILELYISTKKAYRYQVKYEIGSFMLVSNDEIFNFRNKWNDNVYPLSQLYFEYENEEDCIWECEVIGNIYENKELLNEVK